jgi:hypothetical protein
MTEAEKRALAIYEMICATSGDRPFAFGSLELLLGETAAWKAKNPALKGLADSALEVHVAFVKHSFEWLSAEAQVDRNFGVCNTMSDAIQMAMEKAPKPLPADVVLKLLSDFRQRYSMARLYFPLGQFLSLLTRDQVTPEIRDELRQLHLQFAPSPTGKIDEGTQQTRTLIAELIRVEGEKQLDPGRGPWSQIVFDEMKERDEITRTGWEALLEH